MIGLILELRLILANKNQHFQHPLITETLVLQFTKINHGRLINGLQIGYPHLTLALAIAAVLLFILQII